MAANGSLRKAGWLIAAGAGIAAALVYFLDSKRGSERRRRVAQEIEEFADRVRENWEDSLDAELRRPLRYQMKWTPGTRLMAGAVGGSLAVYGFRSRRQLTGAVGLRSAGR